MKREYDLIVLGSGVAGLTAALTASLAGLSCIVLEHAPQIGGTSARSSGTVWVPDNHYLRAEGVLGDRGAAETYLAGLVGDRGDAGMWRAFLESGPSMLAHLAREAGIVFKPFMAAPDYRQDIEGAAPGGRALEPLTFDGRLLGNDFARLAWPLPELMIFGRMMVTRAEAAQLLRADRSPQALLLGLRMMARYVRDRLTHERGTRLVLGNALVARLFKALLDRDVEVLTDVATTTLIRDGGCISGVTVKIAGASSDIFAARGVVLAGGGFPASARWRTDELPEPVAAFTPAAPGADGSTLEMALDAGAVLGPSGIDNALWFPSSIATRADGSTAVYPHIVLDRAKPGIIAVNSAGERFVNEAISYHEFVRGMYDANGGNSRSIPAWLICSRSFIAKYGLGIIRPRTPSLRRYVVSGYVHEAESIAVLAGKIGLPADGLEQTVARFNAFAASGVDTDFGRGETIYDRSNGDPDHTPNPCLGAIGAGPFYALQLLPTPLGTSRGLSANANAQVLDATAAPIPGLYVCGNDMQSAFGGEYPGAGAQLGQGMTFGWIAARHAAGLAQAPACKSRHSRHHEDN